MKIVVVFLTNLLAVVYIFSVYLNLDSSLHVRILREMENAGRKGLSYKELLGKYNKKIILNKRLLRLVNSGEIIIVRNTYQLQKRFSTLLVREKILVFLSKLYWDKSIIK